MYDYEKINESKQKGIKVNEENLPYSNRLELGA